MAYAIQWLRSLLFAVQMYITLPLVALVFSPFVWITPKAVYVFLYYYSRYVLWTLGWMTGSSPPPPSRALSSNASCI